MKALFRFWLTVVAMGCATQTPQGTGQPQSNTQSSTGSLTGKWAGASSGLSVTVALRQAADSVNGNGTFNVTAGSSVGCGGETLPSSGTVTVVGKVTGASFQGRMSFADTWNPPYIGTVSAPDSLNGHFMSIDRGGCPLVLVRQH